MAQVNGDRAANCKLTAQEASLPVCLTSHTVHKKEHKHTHEFSNARFYHVGEVLYIYIYCKRTPDTRIETAFISLIRPFSLYLWK